MANHAPRTTVLESLKDHKLNVIGWQFTCYTCHDRVTLPPTAYTLGLLTVDTHICKGK